MDRSWIKVDKNAFLKPEIGQISERLSISLEEAFARYLFVSFWVDTHVTDGFAKTTCAVIDRAAGMNGFCDAMISCGLIRRRTGFLEFANCLGGNHV